MAYCWDLETFQSTLPVRGATHMFKRWYQEEQISIHAPREGSDLLLICPQIP